MKDIGTPQECQRHCNQEQDCKGFAHLFSNQTCWLKQDILQTVYLSSSPYIGPKQCRDENSTDLAQGIKYQKKYFSLNINNKLQYQPLFLISYYTEIGVKAKQFRGEGECRHACEYLKYHTTYQSNNDGFLHKSFEHVRGEYLSSSKRDTHAMQGIDIAFRIVYQILKYCRSNQNVISYIFITNYIFKDCIEMDMQYEPLDMPGEGRSDEDSARDCQIRCLNTYRCRYFSWWEDGGCHLHDSSAVAISNPGVRAGPKSCTSGILTSVCISFM